MNHFSEEYLDRLPVDLYVDQDQLHKYAYNYALDHVNKILSEKYLIYPVSFSRNDGMYSFKMEFSEIFNLSCTSNVFVVEKDDFALKNFSKTWNNEKYLEPTMGELRRSLYEVAAFLNNETWQVFLYNDDKLVDFSPMYYGNLDEILPKIICEMPSEYADLLTIGLQKIPTGKPTNSLCDYTGFVR